MGHTIEKDPSLYQEPSGEAKRHHVTERPAMLEVWARSCLILDFGKNGRKMSLGEESLDQASKVGCCETGRGRSEARLWKQGGLPHLSTKFLEIRH